MTAWGEWKPDETVWAVPTETKSDNGNGGEGEAENWKNYLKIGEISQSFPQT